MTTQPDKSNNEFATQAQGQNSSIVREFWDLLRHNKKWWLLPVVLALLILGVLVIIGSTGAGAFIYTLF